MFNSKKIGSSLVSFKMISEAPPVELIRFVFHTLGSKALRKVAVDDILISLSYGNYPSNPGIQPLYVTLM